MEGILWKIGEEITGRPEYVKPTERVSGQTLGNFEGVTNAKAWIKRFNEHVKNAEDIVISVVGEVNDRSYEQQSRLAKRQAKRAERNAKARQQRHKEQDDLSDGISERDSGREVKGREVTGQNDVQDQVNDKDTLIDNEQREIEQLMEVRVKLLKEQAEKLSGNLEGGMRALIDATHLANASNTALTLAVTECWRTFEESRTSHGLPVRTTGLDTSDNAMVNDGGDVDEEALISSQLQVEECTAPDTSALSSVEPTPVSLDHTTPGCTNVSLSTQGWKNSAVNTFRRSLSASMQEWARTPLCQRYARNDVYVKFRRMVHDATHPEEDSVPLGHPDTWFTESTLNLPGSGRVTNVLNGDTNLRSANESNGTDATNSVNTLTNTAPMTRRRLADLTRAADSEINGHDSDDDIAIQAMRISTKCPISLTELCDPVTSKKCQHSFERNVILKLIDDSGTRKWGNDRFPTKAVRCPVAGCDKIFCAQDLVQDAILIRKIRRIQRARQPVDDDIDIESTPDHRNLRHGRETKNHSKSRTAYLSPGAVRPTLNAAEHGEMIDDILMDDDVRLSSGNVDSEGDIDMDATPASSMPVLVSHRSIRNVKRESTQHSMSTRTRGGNR